MYRTRLRPRHVFPALFALALTSAPVAFAHTTAPVAFAHPTASGAAALRSAWLPLSWIPAGRLPGETGTAIVHPGLRVTLDPVTRKPVAPTAAQRAAFRDALLGAQAAPEIDAPLPVERIRQGGELVHLNRRHTVFSVVRRDASGRLVTSCVTDPEAASRVAPQTAPAPPPRRAEER